MATKLSPPQVETLSHLLRGRAAALSRIKAYQDSIQKCEAEIATITESIKKMEIGMGVEIEYDSPGPAKPIMLS